jgi:predicted RNA-binding protein YlxR (DUF448 family)
MKKSQPTRMCIACRSRQGRSFYLCDICVHNEKKIKGLVKRFKQDAEQFTKLLEALANEANTCN